MKGPPRLVVRTMAVTFVTVTVILSIVFIALTLDARERVRSAEIEKLRASERVFAGLEARRERDRLVLAATMAEHPTLKAALDTYATEISFGALSPKQESELRATVTREIEKLAASTSGDVVAVLDPDGRVFASAGRSRDAWRAGEPLEIDTSRAAIQGVALIGGAAFRVFGAHLWLGEREVGALLLGATLDDAYARELAALARADIVITVDGDVIARTPPDAVTRDLAGAAGGDVQRLGGEEYAVRVLLESGPARIYALSSIGAATRAATRDRLLALGTLALGSFILAAIASVWLARTVADPINRLSHEIATMTTARAFGDTLEPSGTSREVDALAAAFNDLIASLLAAQGETRAAYLGAIRALAAALDARDPYTAGHSERVSALSVLIAREMNLPEAQVDVIRLGALLHDIGKIGLRDEILRKAGPLTADEFEQIKRHPGLGARILRQAPFFEPHLPIVELHHERPDGKGYPFGLLGDAIPHPARIVHVADAFDAMTSARAYRPAKSPTFAVGELQRFSGTQFDPAAVDALVAALPAVASLNEPRLDEILGRGA
jgi:putative nucleotidyltransferase with HDIG domain